MPAESDFIEEQLHEECLAYNRAIGSFNHHLSNHRERMGLEDIPYRAPIQTPTTVDEMQRLLTHLLAQPRLDSQVRSHPNTVPIHEEAIEHIEIARDQLVATIEDAIQASA